jgi:hypothetical protein
MSPALVLVGVLNGKTCMCSHIQNNIEIFRLIGLFEPLTFSSPLSEWLPRHFSVNSCSSKSRDLCLAGCGVSRS